jgi:hypothetical protein
MTGLAAITARYAPFANDIDGFFGKPEPRRFDVVASGSRRGKRGTYERLDVRWASRVEPIASEIRGSFLGTPENHRAAARIFRGPGKGRPLALLIHGYRAGQYLLEERVWPLDWFLDNGVDVALFVLPFHGVRATAGRSPRFPGSDPRFTIEGFRQAIGDLSDLAATFEADGAPATIALGVSLGGYTASLLATARPLAFVGPIIPLASFADIARAAGRLVGTPEEQRLQHEAIESAHGIVSPLARTPLVKGSRMIIGAAHGDLITPVMHAEKLSKHFEAELIKFPGGHILPIGRRAVFKAIGSRLRELGIFSS